MISGIQSPEDTLGLTVEMYDVLLVQDSNRGIRFGKPYKSPLVYL